MIDLLIMQSIDQLCDWLIDNVTDWSCDWLVGRPCDWLVDWSCDWLVDRSHDWLCECDWLFDIRICWLSKSMFCFVELMLLFGCISYFIFFIFPYSSAFDLPLSLSFLLQTCQVGYLFLQTQCMQCIEIFHLTMSTQLSSSLSPPPFPPKNKEKTPLKNIYNILTALSNFLFCTFTHSNQACQRWSANSSSAGRTCQCGCSYSASALSQPCSPILQATRQRPPSSYLSSPN